MTRILEKNRRRQREQCKKWVDRNFEEPIRALVQEYCRAPIVLYTGAGVSAGPRELVKGKKYGLPTWLGLLKEIARPKSEERWPDDPWEAAEKAAKLCGGPDIFRERHKAIVEREDNYTGKYGQLCSPFVGNAPTLRAVAAFSGQLTGRIFNPNAKSHARVHYRSSANPRVHVVVTTNYDCFLESAASSIYRKSPLKPVTALGSSAASPTRIPVFHVHGYLPHPFYHKEDRQPIVDRLVITREDYEKVWKRNDVFGTTMGPQIHFIRYFTVLFVGFSFTDEYVCELLRRVNADYLQHANRTHFALMHEKEAEERGEDFFSAMGVTPIKYSNHSEIPSKIGTIYRAGLAADQILDGKEPDAKSILPELQVKTHQPTGRYYRYSHEAIWEVMQRSRNESVGAGFVGDLKEELEP